MRYNINFFLSFFLILLLNSFLYTYSQVNENISTFDSLQISKQKKIKDEEIKENDYEYKMPTWHEMITNLPDDWVAYTRETFQTDKIPLYLAVSASTALLILTDNKTYEYGRKLFHTNNFIHKASDIFTAIGDGRTQFGLAIGFAGYGLLFNNAKAVRVGSQIVEAVLASGAVVQVLKHITGRQSPESRTSPRGIWRLFPNQIQYHKHVSAYDAFPSGHLTTTLATVFVIAENYPNIWWIKPLGFTVSGLLAIGMVNRGIHWYSDYPLAIVFGYTFGKLIVNRDNEIIKGTKTLTFLPTIINKGYGIKLAYVF
ncbi:phosphatase PAP2 family protein [Melioribacteraceae bacterium 4301-Me]|uniref:phosphatase PAP2 family protein n=1 Tax=Pyranulibacter aquaticus TaxID=3163344 RepID=UPI0035960473